MSKLNVDQKTILELFRDKKAKFLIPDYQRPYAWTEDECQTLWEDIFAFAFPDNNCDNFDSENDEYFLGPIVIFKNERGQLEVIDGQQRLTTLMLLLRAFYAKLGNMQDGNSVSTRDNIKQCIWKTDEFENADFKQLKIDSEVATDEDKEEFLKILQTGNTDKEMDSNYARNYQFFQEKIDEFINGFPTYFSYLPNRILKNCILLPIEAESQDTALRIFSTLNDRGLPLSDSDIFKAQFYKLYSAKGEKDIFVAQWKELESLVNDIFSQSKNGSMDELFARYMYYERSKMQIKSSTTEALRKFYEKNNYSLFKKPEIFDNLTALAHFWEDVSEQNHERFSDEVLRRFFVLNYAPNSMWTYFVSVYFMQNKDENGLLDNDALEYFLNQITGFIFAYAVTNPGVNALRTPVYEEMVNIVNGVPVTFDKFKFDKESLRASFDNFKFNNNRPITKSMLAWWAFHDPEQSLIPLKTTLEIEHIFPKNRQNKEKSIKVAARLDCLGNKSLLEKKINIRASDYRFDDKKKYYQGFVTSRGQSKIGTQIHELLSLADTKDDFLESDILVRDDKIKETFFDYLEKYGLLENAE